MSFVAVAIGGAAVVGGVTSVVAGNKAANAARDAAATSAQVQQNIFDQTRADQTPWRDTGASALGKLAAIYGLAPPTTSINWGQYLSANPDVQASYDGLAPADKARFATANDYAKYHYENYGKSENRGGVVSNDNLSGDRYGGFFASPSYQFRLDEGMKAIERSAAARGGLRSGATMKALNRYAQDTASQEFGNYVGGLKDLAGVGQSANNTIAQAGQNYATGITNSTMAAGQARASAYENTGNAINGTISNLASAYLYNKGFGTGGTTTTPAPSYIMRG